MGKSAGSATLSSSRLVSDKTGPVDQQAAVRTLGLLVQSVNWGDLQSARQELVLLTSQLGKSLKKEASAPLAKLLVHLRVDLEAGDTASAQSAVTVFVTSLQGGNSDATHAVIQGQQAVGRTQTL